jgi:RsiW-degrading membrane proteinase PrsW (M82 family)
MSKLRARTTPKRDKLTAEDLKQERKFFKIAIIVTIVLIVLIYLIYSNA